MRRDRVFMAMSLAFALIVTPLASEQNLVSVSAAKKIKLSAKKITIQKGKTKKVSVKNAKRKKIKWTIKKKSVASIKKSGNYAVKVKGKKKGKTTLTCKVKNGRKWKSLKCKITVSVKRSVLQTPSSGSSSEAGQNGKGQTGSADQAKPTVTASPTATAASDSTATATADSTATATTTSAPTTTATVTPVITPSATPANSATATPFVPSEYKSAGFESGTDGFVSRGSASLSVVEGGHTGKALSVTGRTASWNGAAFDTTKTMEKGATYTFSAWVKQNESTDQNIKLSMELKVGSDTTWPSVAQVTCKSGVWTHIEGTYTVPAKFDSLLFYFEGPDGTYDFLIDDITVRQETQGIEVLDPLSLPSLKDAYKDIFPRFGNVLSYNTSWNDGYQLQSEETMAFVKKQFNSFSLENEMKPDQLLPSWSGTISVDAAKNLGYVIPDDYKETVVAKLNFDNLDKILEKANEYGIPMRAHVLMWHQQTATRFFKTDYDDEKETVSEEVMDARLKFFVRSVMKHVMEKEKELTGKAGTLVYCWDVTNEYVHRSNNPTYTSWMDVYGDQELHPTYVKLAYQTAYDMLKQYGLEKEVTLFYNDYNEYDCADEIVQLVSYINEGEPAKICGGIGMQSHISTDYPSVEKYGAAVDKFLATGLEVQATELDIGIETGKTEEDQAQHYKDILTLLVNKHQNRDTSVNAKGITGVTIWGLYDSLSWRRDTPLLFGSGLDDPKPAFYSVLEVAK